MARSAYDVKVTREGRWWIVRVPELDELTQARRVSEVEQMARELIAITTDSKISDVQVTVTVEVEGLGDVVGEALHIRSLREHAAKLEAQASDRARYLAQALASAHVPVRDIGSVLGVSYQRAHQLIDR
ncbi:HicB family toxin-antitoxin system [Hoyosella sp. YIM 151337]|uniref:HicB family toxin-antitoxin system n=1 Tax=Hoyosella sp. YIM 151337 TaxID=2992742 RepID=UPI002235C404|nr:HicB family toxin-antitoxin system [Hoyosella sp. YIM 151337]MCW4352002.1 HicB family toxin-antitoxin system [Hoyosella sp. YIM 151337]